MNLSRPPHSANPLSRNRPAGSGHHYHASADFDSSSSPAYRASPLGDVMSQTPLKHTSSNPDYEQMDKATEKWLADLEEYQSTLEEMATASLDANFKAEINSIEQWFQILNEAEQTAALYTLLQHASPVQIRFLIAVLQQLAKSDPLSAVLSPASFEKEAMQSRLNEALNLNQPSPTFNRSVGRNSAFSSVIGDRNNNPESTDRSRLLPKTKSSLYSSGVFTPDRGPTSASRSSSLRASSGVRGGNDAVGSGGIHGSAAGILLSSRAAPASPWNNQFSATISRPRSADIGWRNPPLSPHINDTPSNNGTASSVNDNVTGDHPYSFDNSSSVWNNPVVGSKPENPGSGFSGGLDNTDMLVNSTAYKLSALQTASGGSTRSVGSPVVTLDPDVAKFRRNNFLSNGTGGPSSSSTRKSAGGSNSTPTQSNGKQGSTLSNSGQSQETVLLYNSSGQLVSVPRSQLVAAGSQIHTASPLVNNNRPIQQHVSPGADEEFSTTTATTNHWQSAVSPQLSEFSDSLRQTRLNNCSPSLRSQLGMASVSRHRREMSQGSLTNSPNSSRVNSPARSGTGERPRERSRPPAEDIIDLDLLNNISAWLRTLRLHKYTDVLKDMDWKDLVQLDDAGLEARGVNALGARRKMLKVFEKVKEAQTEGKLPR